MPTRLRLGVASIVTVLLIACLTTVTVAAAGPTPATSRFGPAFYGVNDDYNGAAEFTGDSSYLTQLDQLGPQTLRWPGGTGADYFDWRTGKVTDLSSSYTFTLKDLYRQYQATDAPPIFDLNVLAAANRTNTSDQIEMLKRARSLGLPIDYVELGNEFYYPGPNDDFVNAFPTGSDYGTTVGIYVRALHQAFPGVQVAAVGCLNPKAGNTRQQDWNQDMMTAAANAGGLPDAVTLHVYPGPNISGFTGSPTQLASLFEGPYNAISNLSTVAGSSALEGRPVWITEYNMATGLKGTNSEQLTYAHELFLASLGLMLPRVDNAALVDTWSAFAERADEGAWDDPANPTLTPDGQAIEMVDQAARGRESSAPLDLPGPTLSNGGAEVLGQAFTSPGAPPHAVIVNLSGSAQHVPAGRDIPTGSSYSQVTGTPGAALTVAPTPFRGTVGTRGLTLQPYSVTTIGASI